MKIVHVEDCFLPTAGYQINFLAKWNSFHGHEVTVVTTDSLLPWSKNGFVSNLDIFSLDLKYSKSYNVEIKRIKSFGRISGREFASSSLFRLLHNLNPDIVLVHGFETLTGLRFLWNFNKLNYPIIFDSHMIEAASKNKFRKLFKLYMQTRVVPRIKKFQIPIVAVSEATKKFLIENYKLSPELVSVIPLGTDTDLFHPYSEDNRKFIRKSLDLSESDFVFVYTGKITKDKKIHLLVDAFEKVSKATSNINLIIVGSGNSEYANQIKNRLKRNKKIIMLPTQPVDKLPKLYAAADVAVWPGASSLSFYDAQACGLPVLLEKIDINIERTKYGNGLTFIPDSPENLAKKMLKMKEMKLSKLRSMGKKGKNIVWEKFSYNKLARDFEILMEKQIKLKVMKSREDCI